MKKVTMLLLACLIAGLAFGDATLSSYRSFNSAFTMGAKSSSGMIVDFALPEYTVTDEVSAGVTYKKVEIPRAGTLLERGLPELPTITTSIAVPANGRVSVEVLSSQQSTLSGFIPYPVQQGEYIDSPKSFAINQEYYSNGSNYPEAAIQYSDPMILRDFRIVTIQINPFSYNAQSGDLTVHNNIRFKLNFINEPAQNELAFEPEQISSVFSNLYEAMILNFDDYRSRLVPNSPPKILMIYGYNSDPLYISAIEDFALWKRQKGADVMLASTAANEAGTSNESIKNYILAKYNNLATRPDFVILIGDTGPSYAIPAYTVANGGGDYPYTHLAGNDLLGDCFIGRISVENLSQLSTVLNKIYLYERDINIATAGWLNRILLEADNAPSGISTMYISKYIKELSLLTNPNYTFTEAYSSSPSLSIATQAINQGVGFYSFRGYIDWVPPSESSLTNAFRLHHAVVITCATGNYSGGLAETEQLLRYGTPAVPKGSVTAIGMSTASTHTTFNNVLHGGIFDGVFAHNMRTMGEAVLHGKLYMHQIFGVSSPSNVQSFTHWCNLMGDPTMEVFTGIPNFFNVVSEPLIPLGLSLYDVAVTDSANIPVEGAAVTLSLGSVILTRGYTDAEGHVVLVLPTAMTAGNAVLTVSKHNFKPKQNTISIVDIPTLVPGQIVIDDDNLGDSIGDNNGIAGNGETLEVLFALANTGTAPISGLSGTITTDSPYINIVNSQISYISIPGGQEGFNTAPVVIQVAPNTPNGTMLRLFIDLTDNQSNEYHISEFMSVEAPKLSFTSYLVIDTNNQVLDPGEEAELTVTVKNIGAHAVDGIYATLTTLNDILGISDNEAFFGSLPVGIDVTAGTNRFSVFARSVAIPGMIIPLRMRLFNDSGFEQYVDFTLTIGSVTVNDPLGPDAYGYVIYDWMDIGYNDVPIYDWRGISPAEGGLGTALSISDGYVSGNEGDQVGANSLAVVDLPFPFQFYGRVYNQITVCSNGFIAMGVTANAEFRNFRLPGAMGPSPMIAAFWDDLATVSGSGIYTWYNHVENTFTIEWYNMRNGGANGTYNETFQVILYNPTTYPTSLGDGPIKIQYHTFNNVDSQTGSRHGNYATIGIKDHTGRVGLEYTFNNVYPTAAAPLSHRKAIYITNAPTYYLVAHLVIDATHIDDANGNGVCEPGETVNMGVGLTNSGNVIAENVHAVISTTSPYISFANSEAMYFPLEPAATGVNQLPFTFTVSPNCPDGEVVPFTLTVTSGEMQWNRLFSVQVKASSLSYHSHMVDDHETNFNGVIDAGESFNLIVNLSNDSVIDAKNVAINLSSSNPLVQIANPVINMESIAPNDVYQLKFQVDCSAVPITDAILPFQLNASSSNGSPLLAIFELLYNNPNINNNFEQNNGQFISETGWVWGTHAQISAHSGQKLWATNLSGEYPNLVEYHLYTPQYLLTTNSQLSFYHRYGFETGYDGANVSISTDGGETWTIITPSSGYSSNSLNGLNGQPGWTGNSPAWTNPTFNLSSYANQNVMFRFRFGSDGATSSTGWLIDSFQLTGVDKTLGYLHGLVYPTSGISPTTVRVKSNQRYTTNPNQDGQFKLFLPNGTHNVVASVPFHQSSAVNNVVINPQTPVQYTEFTLIDLPNPIGLSFTVNNDTGVLNLNWQNPIDPVLPVLGFKVYKRFNTGSFVPVATTELTTYTETLSYMGTYEFYIRVQYLGVEGSPSETISFAFPYSSNPQDDNAPILVTGLESNYPNPFNPSTTIAFTLAKSGNAKLAIYNLKGQLVKSLVNAQLSQGRHTVVWNGLDENNHSVASGMYFYRFESGEHKSVKKMLLMK